MKKKIIYILVLLFGIFCIVELILKNYTNKDLMENSLDYSYDKENNIMYQNNELKSKINGDFLFCVSFIKENVIYTGVISSYDILDSLYLMDEFKSGVEITISNNTIIKEYDTLKNVDINEIENGDLIFISGMISYYSNGFSKMDTQQTNIYLIRKNRIYDLIKEELIDKNYIISNRLEIVNDTEKTDINRINERQIYSIVPIIIDINNYELKIPCKIILGISENYLNKIFEEKKYLEADLIIIRFNSRVKDLEVDIPIVDEIIIE